ncbi:RNA-directed DNA polymerase from mobile element jockey [Trichonephila clavipes]|nr:RNA-directed DNA polymerase from mobile element jockey [Trichonephila clavipes]
MPKLKLFGNGIPWTKEVDYLGVTLDSKLTYKNHLNKITCKFKKTLLSLLPLLNRNSSLSLHSKRIIYIQYFQPILTYACQIWGSAAPSNINKLQIEQNKALRIMTNYPRYIARKYLHRDAGVEPINDRIRSLAIDFHNHVITHPNTSISIQPFLVTSGTRNHPISSTNLSSQF